MSYKWKRDVALSNSFPHPPPPPKPHKKIPSMHATVQVDTKCFLFNSNLEIRTEKYKRYINILLLLLTLDRET